MPLVVLSGNPSSGKSTVALCIQEECKKMGIVSDVVSEESLRLDRNSCYKGTFAKCWQSSGDSLMLIFVLLQMSYKRR
jgi:tRNA uridine 5-carbamoylmethylation protein Kti12